MDRVMLGRGLIADPAMIVRLQGGTTDIQILRAFHDELCSEYIRVFGDRNSAMHRMKAIWSHLLARLPNGESYRKRLIKTRTWEDFLVSADEVFDQAT